MGLPYDLENEGSGNTQTNSPKFIIDTLSNGPHNSANEFNFQLQSGKLKFVNIQAKLSGSFPVDKFLVPNTWKTRFQIDNSKKLTIQRPIFITRLEDDVVFIPEEIKNLEYEIEFEHITTTPATSSAFLTSYADVTFGNLRTFSGDVNKVKLFGRQKDKQNAEFEKFGEFILETKNELKDSTSITGDDPVGIFYSQSVVDNFWQSSSAAQPIEIDNTQIMNAVLVSGSNYADGNFVEFKTKNQFELEKNEEYIVSFQSYYIKKNKQQADGSVRKSAEIEVFLSGSVISQTGGTLSLGSVSDSGDNASELLKGNVSGSIPRLYNYFTTHKKSGIKPKAGLIFRVNAGEFYISNVKLEPVSDRNFNPGFYKTIVPMPIGSRRGQRYDFVSEFYDSNNNKADFEAVTSASVAFAGAPQVLADGTDAVLSGSVQIGNSMEMYGVNPAYLRSIGYNGFNKTLAGTGDRNGGFMLWSGSIGSTIGASETYNGVGLEVVDASSTNKHEHAFLQFASNYKGTGNPRFRVQTNEFLLGVSGSGAAETFISGSQGKLRISSSNFHLDDDGAVTMQGTITAAAGGTIGGFTIGSDNLTATNFVLNTTDKLLSLGSGDNIFIADADTGIQLGDATFADAPFSVTPAGLLKATSGTIGGFTIDADEIKAGSTLILDSDTNSGQIKLGGATSIIAGSDGIYMDGTGDFRVGDADGERISFDASAESLVISSSTFMIGSKASGKSFISASDAYGLEISSSNFHLSASGKITASAVKLSGDITAQTGNIGGFVIGSSTLTGTNFTIDTSDKSISLGSGNNIFIADADSGIQLGHATFGSAPFRVSPAGALTATSATIQGAITATSGDIGGFNIDSTTLFSDSKEFVITGSTGQITGSKVLFTGGKIGGFTLSSTALTGTNFTLDTSGKSLTLGSGDDVFIADADTGIQLGDSTFADAPFSVTEAGVLKAQSGTIGGFTLSTNALTATNFSLDPSNKRITLGTGTNIFIADGDEGIQLGNGTFANAPFSVTKAGVLKAEQGFIGGFAINSGSIETNDFASGLKGLRLSTAANGTIEAQNARIRGTLSTTVFEKETVNAVGGQLLVANSTAITSSIFHSKPVSASQTTMSVVNVTGFVANEILLIKKVGDTGFSTEYVKVVSASRDAPSSDKNFSGRLFVNRAINSGSMSSAGMFMESGSSAQQYEDGQVVVSTGKIGTGFIKLNANPNDIFTPYIDIVERTGSAVYDIDLKARLGDLSGLSSALVGSDPGFGLFSENVFLTGKITSTEGAIGGWDLSANDLSSGNVSFNSNTERLKLGAVTDFAKDGSDKGILIGKDGSDYEFFVGAENGNFIHWNGSTLNIDGTISIGSMNGAVSSSAQIASDISGSSAAGLASINAITGSILDKTGSIDLQVARVVIHNAGMYLRNQGGDTLASYGSSIALGTSGSNEENILIDGSSVDIRSGTTSLADFGSTVRIGKSGQARTEITDTAISMYDGQGTPRKRVAINNAGVIAVGGASGADVAVDSTDEVVRIDSSGVNIFNDSDNFTFVSGSGMSVFSGGNKVAQFASEVKIGDFEDATKSFVKIDNNSLDIMAGTTVTASFGATTTLGNTSNEHIQISGSGIELKDGGTQKLAIQNSGVSIGTPGQARTTITDTDISMFDGAATPIKRVELDSSGKLTLGKSTDNRVEITDSAFKLYEGSNERINIISTGVQIKEDANNFTEVSASGMSVFSGGDKVAQFASEVKIGDFEDATKSFVKIDGDSLDIMAGTTVTASFGATTTIGNTATEHVSISSTELKLKDGNGGGTDIDYVTINSSGMQIGDDITISTAGASSLSIGGLANVTDIGDASKGFLVDSSGNVLIKQGGANKNYMQFNSGVIDLQSDTFNLVTTGSGAGEDGGIIINSAQPQIMVSGSGTTSGNSVRLLGDEGVIEVSQSGAGVFDTGRTKTFTTTNIIEPDIFKPGARAFTTESITTTSLPSPTSENMFITSNLSVGNVLETDGFLIDTTSANTPFSIIQKVSRAADANLNDGASQPTASFAVVQENNFSGESSATNNNCHPGFVFQADYYTELETADNSIGWVQGSVPSGSNIFTIGTKLTGVEAADFEDAKFNILGLEANTAGIGNTTKENQYTFLQAKHSSSIRLQIQHDGDIVSKGNITAFGTSFLTVSDKREKKDICTISESLDRILELRPTKFTWKKTDKQDVGFIAQEVEKIIPEAIEISRGFINTDNDQERKTISYPKLVPYLVDTIQVLTKRIEELEKKVK